MSAARPNTEPVEEQAGPSVPRERASADYERPRENVADIPDPVTLPTNKARQGEARGHMRVVLVAGIALAILAFAFGYLFAE